jgi:hypothetical protein
MQHLVQDKKGKFLEANLKKDQQRETVSEKMHCPEIVLLKHMLIII